MNEFDFFPSQYERIVELLRPSQAFLVGGAVRDLLLRRPVHDLDFTLSEGTISTAKRIADQLGGGFFVLDPERETCRVILDGGGKQRLVVDFTLFQGETIEEDLSARDFTITSMALDLREENGLIDPLQGAQDLKDGLIRASSDRALENDPLRCIRAVRLASQLGFHILPGTREQIRRYRGKLSQVSPERKRDELFRLLEGPHQSAGLLALQMLGLYDYLFPGEFPSQQVGFLGNLEKLWSLFLEDHDQEGAGSWFRGLLIHRLGRYRKRVKEYLAQEMVPGRSVYQLTFLIPLLSSFVENQTPESIRQITHLTALSNQEAVYLTKGIAAAESWSSLSREERESYPVDVFRYFDRFDAAGIAGIYLGLAGGLDNQLLEGAQDNWIQQLGKARYYLEGYWEHHQAWVDPPRLLDGDDIQREFKLAPGPVIGSLLYSLREEQVRCGLQSRKEGLEFLKEQVSQLNRTDS